jgi:hypothetical protein
LIKLISPLIRWSSTPKPMLELDCTYTLPFKRRLLSSILHHASWLRPLRYKLVMIDVIMNFIMRVKVKVTMMTNPLKIN